MISTLNLLWIIPLSAMVGGIGIMFIISSSMNNREEEIYREGFKRGYDLGQCEKRGENSDGKDR